MFHRSGADHLSQRLQAKRKCVGGNASDAYDCDLFVLSLARIIVFNDNLAMFQFITRIWLLKLFFSL